MSWAQGMTDSTQLSKVRALKEQLAGAQQYIAANPQQQGSYECVECFPASGIVKAGFACVYHAARKSYVDPHCAEMRNHG